MSQGKLNGLIPQTQSQPTNTGYSPTPNQSTIGQFGNTFGQPGPVGTPGGFGQPAQPAQPLQSTSSQPPQPYVTSNQPPQPYVSGLGTGPGNSIGPVAPNDDGIGNDGNQMFLPNAPGAISGATPINAGYGYPGQAVPDWNLGATPISPGNPLQTQATYGATQATPGATPISAGYLGQSAEGMDPNDPNYLLMNSIG